MSKLKRVLASARCLSFLQLGPISAEASQGGSTNGQSMPVDTADSVVTTDTCANVLEPQSATQDEPKLEKLVTYDPTTYQVTGFTPEGIKIIKRLRDDVRKMHKQYASSPINLVKKNSRTFAISSNLASAAITKAVSDVADFR